ncbi:MAG: c-type cytochrome [Thiohalocapsa sp.]
MALIFYFGRAKKEGESIRRDQLLNEVMERHMQLMRLLLAALLVTPFGLKAATDDEELEPDLEAGGVMFRQCALCHGQHGQGILGGKYPRIAGMPEYYLLNALQDYKAGERGSEAMVVVGALQTAEEQDLTNLAAYISDLDVTRDVPAPEDGNARSGKSLYKSDCKTCHGRKGEGKSRKESPPLRGQYHEYLQRQIGLFQNNERIHADDPDDETFVDYKDEELTDILAFIASLDDEATDDGKDDDRN